jgi:methyltransferase (TIGR00027 family)
LAKSRVRLGRSSARSLESDTPRRFAGGLPPRIAGDFVFHRVPHAICALRDEGMSVTVPVECVADTAFVTAYCRVLETERSDSHFRDPHARRLAGPRGERLLKSLPGWETTAANCAIRTHLFDQMLLSTIQQKGIDAVVNLGAGLDTRPYRLALPAGLHWFEVDAPDILEYKAAHLSAARAACVVESVPLDLADEDARRRLLERIAATAANVLVITEGVIVYMSEEQVASLAADLRRTSQGWLTDIVSRTAHFLMEKEVGSALASTSSRLSVRFQFAPADSSAFFRRCGWEAIEARSCVAEGRLLNRWMLAKALLSAPLSQQQQDVIDKFFLVVNLHRAPAPTRLSAHPPESSVSEAGN